MTKTKLDKLDKFMMILVFIFLMIPFYFFVIDVYKDEAKIPEMVCEDMGLKMINKHKSARDVSNESDKTIIRVFYKVECSDDNIYSYKPYRYIHWTNSDCSIKDKWGDCKSVFPKRIKSIGYILK